MDTAQCASGARADFHNFPQDCTTTYAAIMSLSSVLYTVQPCIHAMCDCMSRKFQCLYRLYIHIHFAEISGDGENHFDLSPFSDEELLRELLHNSVDVMLMADSPLQPSFTIVSPQDFLLSSADSVRHHSLPTNFIISLSYKPLNNTVLSLFSLLSYSEPSPANTQQNSNNTNTSTFATFQSELMLSQSATLVHSDSYYDLWRDFSTSTRLRYTLNLIVKNGRVGMCLDGDYHPPVETVQLWKNVEATDSLELRFSPHLTSVSSLVKRILTT